MYGCTCAAARRLCPTPRAVLRSAGAACNASPPSSRTPRPPPDHPVVSSVRAALLGPARVPPGAALVACVSGGVDSVGLLLALSSLQTSLGFTLHVLHFNHGLRAASAGEAALVARLAEHLALPFHLRERRAQQEAHRLNSTADAPLWPAAGVPAAARAWRRAESLALARTLGATARVATGHTLDDQRETLLLKLLRGVHVSRLDGMAPSSGAFVRPLLAVRKTELASFVRDACGEVWAEDASNCDPSCSRRNAVRLRLVPLLQSLVAAPPAHDNDDEEAEEEAEVEETEEEDVVEEAKEAGGKVGGGASLLRGDGGVVALDARLAAMADQSRGVRELLDAQPTTWREMGGGGATPLSPRDDGSESGGGSGGAPRAAVLSLPAWAALPSLARADQLHAFLARACAVSRDDGEQFAGPSAEEPPAGPPPRSGVRTTKALSHAALARLAARLEASAAASAASAASLPPPPAQPPQPLRSGQHEDTTVRPAVASAPPPPHRPPRPRWRAALPRGWVLAVSGAVARLSPPPQPPPLLSGDESPHHNIHRSPPLVTSSFARGVTVEHPPGWRVSAAPRTDAVALIDATSTDCDAAALVVATPQPPIASWDVRCLRDGARLRLRPRADGDTIEPPLLLRARDAGGSSGGSSGESGGGANGGGGRRRKLVAFLRERRVPLHARDAAPVLLLLRPRRAAGRDARGAEAASGAAGEDAEEVEEEEAEVLGVGPSWLSRRGAEAPPADSGEESCCGWRVVVEEQGDTRQEEEGPANGSF